MNKITALAAGGALAAAVALGACAQPVGTSHSGGQTSAPAATTQPSTSPPETGPLNLSVGQQLGITQNGRDAGTVTVKSVRATTQPADSFGSGPQNGYFVIADVTVSSTVNGLYVNELDFYALVNGNHYDTGNGNSFDAVSGVPPDLTATLNAGETTSGTLFYDVPSTHGQIVYSPNLRGAPLAEWSF